MEKLEISGTIMFVFTFFVVFGGGTALHLLNRYSTT
jgi:hypothetical protein